MSALISAGGVLLGAALTVVGGTLTLQGALGAGDGQVAEAETEG